MTTDVTLPAEAAITVTIQIAASRFAHLQTMATLNEVSIEKLATKFLEEQIEAEHGLSFGPYLRRHMYRS